MGIADPPIISWENRFFCCFLFFLATQSGNGRHLPCVNLRLAFARIKPILLGCFLLDESLRP